MSSSTVQGRHTIIDTPISSPGQCVICGYGGPDRRYLDSRLDFEFYGTVYWCETCVAELARMFGYIEPSQALALERRVQEAERELVNLRAVALAVEDFKRAVGIDAHVSIGASDFWPSDEHVASGIIEGEQELPFEPDSGEGSDDSGSDEQVAERGRDDVRDPDAGKFDLDFI